MIDSATGALVLEEGRVAHELTRTEFAASPLARDCRVADMKTGWTHFDSTHVVDQRKWLVRVSFRGERLDGYSLCLDDERFGASWDGWSEEKELARRDAHDAWLAETLGTGARTSVGELQYTFAWGEVSSAYDACGGSSSIGVRFLRR